jgi:hypothetical protein
MDGPTAEQLAELSKRYQGKEPGEQEYVLAMALVDIGSSNQIPDLGPKDFWLRLRDEVAGRVIELRVAISATAVVAAQQILVLADSRGLSSVLYEIPLAILTAMVVDSVINAMDGWDRNGDDSSGK